MELAEQRCERLSRSSSGVGANTIHMSGLAARLSKARFDVLQMRIADVLHNDAVRVNADAATAAVILCICEVLNFDPKASSYQPAQAMRMKTWRNKKMIKAEM